MKSGNRKYSNGEIIIFWRAALCVHNTSCYRTLRSVFDPSKRPWVNPLGASSDEIKKVIEKCPTEALMFKWVDGSRNINETSPKLYKGDMEMEFGELAKDSNLCTVSLRPNGPIIVEGDCEFVSDDNSLNVPIQKMYSFCRCGASRNMPFCDGRHFTVGFSDKK